MNPNIIPIIAGVIVLVALAVGHRDVLDFRLRRVRAIAGVCFTEAVRRRILWITPMAMLGILAVSLLARPVDEMDAIRQTITYSLFASSIVVVIAAVLLAATNLPKEIDSRVIFTIVTKPTTRLEIVLGKVLGFAQISALILIVMGLFTWGYLRVRASTLTSRIQTSLKDGSADPMRKIAMQEYARSGLLSTRSLAWPQSLEVTSRVPSADRVEWMAGGRGQYYVEFFSLDQQAKNNLSPVEGAARFHFLMIDLTIDQHTPTAHEAEELKQGGHAVEGESTSAGLVLGPVFTPPVGPTTAAAAETPKVYIPQLIIETKDHRGQKIADHQFDPAKPFSPAPRAATTQPSYPIQRSYPIQLEDASLGAILEHGQFAVEVGGNTPTYEFKATPKSTYLATFEPVGFRRRSQPPVASTAPTDGVYMLASVASSGQTTVRLEPVRLKAGEPLGFAPLPELGKVAAVVGSQAIPVEDDGYLWLKLTYRADAMPADPLGNPAPQFYARLGRAGMQIRGAVESDRVSAIGVYSFRSTNVGTGREGKVGLQLKTYVDRAGDLDAGENAISKAAVRVKNLKSGKISDPVYFVPETSRLSYVGVDTAYFDGGNFDVLVNGLTPGQWLGLHGPTASTPGVGVVRSEDSFEANLFKSLFMLWMLAVLVVILAVFCSTFLSWPIAVMLTLLLLLGRWGVNELGDSLAPGSARTVASELFGGKSDPAKDKAVTAVFEGMNTALRNAATVLPDIAKFPVTEDINRGVTIPAQKLIQAGWEVVLYGIPLTMLTYLIFRRKEVAP